MAHPHHPHRAGAVALAALVCTAGAAHAADHVWTAGAGRALPYWDLSANWSPSPPAGTTARVLLGAYDTRLRSGMFDVGHVLGSGELWLQGGQPRLEEPVGQLRLNQQGSVVGRLRLDGGDLTGPGGLTVNHLRWNAGGIGVLQPYSDPPSRLTVLGTATIGNGDGKYVGYGSTLELLGRSAWIDGGSRMHIDGTLRLGASARLDDRAVHGTHRLHIGTAWLNDGHYIKTGRGRTEVEVLSGADGFYNHGRFEVRQGSLSLWGTPSGNWVNTGHIEVRRGAWLDMSVFRYGQVGHSGSMQVDGRADFAVLWSGLTSTGDWRIGRGGALNFTNDSFDEFRSRAIVFESGEIRNDGQLGFKGGDTVMKPGVNLSGTGTLQVADGARVVLSQALEMGTLRLDGLNTVGGGPGQWGQLVAPAVQVRQLDWGHGDLVVPDIAVSGSARLHGGPVYTTQGEPGHRKLIDGKLVLGGRSTWTGETDIAGAGHIRIGAGGVFHDTTAANLQTGADEFRPLRLGVARFENRGLYLKTGAGDTEVTGYFENPGRLRVEGSGRLIFSGTLEQTGTLEIVNGAELEVALGNFSQMMGGESWIDGVVRAAGFGFSQGRLGAGTAGGVGHARLAGGDVVMIQTLLDVDIAGADLHDVLTIDSALALTGRLFANFGGHAPGDAETYRVLTAAGGIQGSFELLTNLDETLYSLSAVYGDTYLDLVVARLDDFESPGWVTAPTAPVPEPGTWALMLGGIGLLGWRARRRAAVAGRRASQGA